MPGWNVERESRDTQRGDPGDTHLRHDASVAYRSTVVLLQVFTALYIIYSDGDTRFPSRPERGVVDGRTLPCKEISKKIVKATTD